MTRTSKKARQSMWLQAYTAKAFNIAKACREVGIDRSTYYRWLDDDQKFTQAVKDAREEKIDYVETQLFKRISKGDTTAIIFALKTLGKSRGYIERQEIGGPEGTPLPPIDVKVLLQKPNVRIALETIAKEVASDAETDPESAR